MRTTSFSFGRNKIRINVMNIKKTNITNVKASCCIAVQSNRRGWQQRVRESLRNVTRCGLFTAAAALLVTHRASADSDDFAQQILPFQTITTSTMPANGDVNPYGVVLVPKTFPAGGSLNPGDVLVSNFNNNQNVQGTGTIIVKIAPNGQQSLFFQGTLPLGF